jgi:hypothetical protein
MLHYKVDRIASLAAPEAFIDPFYRRYGERRSFFVMKRAETKIVDTPAFKVNKLPHHIQYLGGIKDFINGFVWYQNRLLLIPKLRIIFEAYP